MKSCNFPLPSKLNASFMALAIGAAVTATSAANAAELEKVNGYPSRLISAVVPFGQGGGADTLTRAWARPMEKITGVPFQVENVSGGGGLAALPNYMSRPKDGYAVLEHDDALAAAQAAGQLNVEIGEDIVPICTAQIAYSQFYIRPDDDRFNDWKSFIDYAKAHPGDINMATSDAEQGMEVVQGRAIENAAGFETTWIRYDKGSERFAALMGGQADALIEQPGDVHQYIEADRMKPILTILHERAPRFPDVPALNDAGLSNMKALKRTRMFWVHADAPKERREYLERACRKAYESDEFQALNDRMMIRDNSYYNSEETLELVRETIEIYREDMEVR